MNDQLACALCGHMPARVVPIRRVVGLIVWQRWISVEESYCRTHGTQRARSFLLATLWQGWWGVFSLFLNVFVVTSNVSAWARYARLAPPHQPADPAAIADEARYAASLIGTWEPDLYRRHQLRWFTGTRWTEHVRDGEVESIDPPGWQRR